MNVSEILITVSLTVAAAVAIAYTTFKLQTKHRERVLSRALLDEVKLNLSLARLIKSGDSTDLSLSGYPALHTGAYDNTRLAGELLSLKENVREKLQYLYEMIIMHNREISQYEEWGGWGATRRLDGIIQRLELLENELAKEVQKPTKRSDYAQNDLLQRYVMLQVSLFFFFGLISIYAYYLGELDTGANMSIWDWVHHIVRQALMPIGIASIAWAIILSVVSLVGLNRKMPRTLKGVREKIIGFVESESAPIVYVASMVVFGVSVATTWAALLRTDIGVVYRDIILGIALALIAVFFVDNILSARHRRAPEAKTKNDSEMPDHGA